MSRAQRAPSYETGQSEEKVETGERGEWREERDQ
jgi:hypothetical protein